MAIFKDKKKKGDVPAAAPEEPETPGEQDYSDELSGNASEEEVPEVQNQEVQIREVPVCMSQSQINNMIIDNNMMLKHIVSKLEED